VNRVIKVAVVQMECENGNVPRNLRHAEELVESATTQPTSAPSLTASLPFRRKDVAAFDRWIAYMPGHFTRTRNPHREVLARLKSSAPARALLPGS
jgi:hypothetical protein